MELVRGKLRDINASWSEELASLLPTVISDAALARMSTQVTPACPPPPNSTALHKMPNVTSRNCYRLQLVTIVSVVVASS